MKKHLLNCSLCCCLTFSFAQHGVLDPSFGNKGIVKMGMGALMFYNCTGKIVLTQTDGSLFIIFTVAGTMQISKFQTNGSIDKSFGNNGYSDPVSMSVGGAILQGGKIIVVGSTIAVNNNRDFAIARFNTNGNIDSSFDTDGLQKLDLGDNESGSAVAIQPDNKIVIAGQSFNGDKQFVVLARYNQNGSLDESFGTNGIQTADLGFNDYSASIAIQQDGKIVVGGLGLLRYNSSGIFDSTFGLHGRVALIGAASSIGIQNNNKIIVAINTADFDEINVRFGILRYDLTGKPDSSFGTNGVQKTDFKAIDQFVNAMAIQNDGKIILGGYTINSLHTNFAIARYKLNGNPDSGFANNGLQQTALNPADNFVNSIAIQGDGKLIAMGSVNNGDSAYVIATRYNLDGKVDYSLGQNGTITENIIQGLTCFTGTAVQKDGKIIAGGYTWNGSSYDFALARFNINGNPDNTFSLDGQQITDLAGEDDRIRAIAIQPDGKIIAAGSAGSNLGMARYNTDGSLDNTFDHDGKLLSNFGSEDSITSILIQPDGKIIAGGTVITRYNIDGTVDLSFGQQGKIITTLSVDNMALQQDGKILVLGMNPSCMIARFNSNGSADGTFGESGERSLTEYASDYENVFGKSIAIQSDGKIIIDIYIAGGYRVVTLSSGLLRLNIDGSLDYGFNNGDIVYTNFNLGYSNSLLTQSDSKILVAGYSYNGSSDDFTLNRYNADGSLDETFGSNGVVQTRASLADDKIEAAAIRDNKLYTVGYGQYPGYFGLAARYLLDAEGGPLNSTFISAKNGNWEDPFTWVGGIVPYSTSIVIVQHTVTITTAISCYSLKISPPAGHLVVTSGNNLIITH